MLAKPEPYRKAKARRLRLDKVEKDRTREIVQARDGYCRLLDMFVECFGASERNHLVRQSKTRGLSPEERHDVRDSIMCCSRHHALVDQHVVGHEFLDQERRANGRMRFAHRDGRIEEEP